MIVDDDELVLTMYEVYFRDLGQHVVACSSADVALTMARTFLPDIVITDMRMPGMDGLSLLTRLKEEQPCVEVIVISGHADTDAAIQCFREGAVDFLRKPVTFEAIMEGFHKAAKRVHLRRCDEAAAVAPQTALEGMIDAHENEMSQFVRSIRQRLDTVVYPQIDRLVESIDDAAVVTELAFVKELIRSAFPFSDRTGDTLFNGLSPLEVRICEMIRQWKSAQDIAEALNMSIYTVYDHQKKIRRKLGLLHKGTSLARYIRESDNAETAPGVTPRA
jgi:FixJ family two-component response regulator